MKLALAYTIALASLAASALGYSDKDNLWGQSPLPLII